MPASAGETRPQRNRDGYLSVFVDPDTVGARFHEIAAIARTWAARAQDVPPRLQMYAVRCDEGT